MSNKNNPFSFASRLRSLREERRLSKTALAKLLGVSTTCVWNWEEGNTEPRRENLLALGEALNVSAHFLEIGRQVKEAGPELRNSDTIEELSLPEVITKAKEEIARLAGTVPESVSISVAY